MQCIEFIEIERAWVCGPGWCGRENVSFSYGFALIKSNQLLHLFLIRQQHVDVMDEREGWGGGGVWLGGERKCYWLPCAGHIFRQKSKCYGQDKGSEAEAVQIYELRTLKATPHTAYMHKAHTNTQNVIMQSMPKRPRLKPTWRVNPDVGITIFKMIYMVLFVDYYMGHNHYITHIVSVTLLLIHYFRSYTFYSFTHSNVNWESKSTQCLAYIR